MTGSRGAQGQATAEYVALVALVGVVLALAAGLTSGGLGSNVLAGIQRGLCRVVGGACARPIAPRADLDPCPLTRAERAEQLSETLAVVRFGASATLSAVRTSDGHVTVTLADGGSSGRVAGAGLRLSVGTHAIGGQAEAALAATWTSGRSWTLPNEAAARRFVAAYGAKATIGGQAVDLVRSGCSLLCDAIGWRPHPQLPQPDEVFEGAGATASLSGSLGAADGELSLGAVLGSSIRRDGATTWFLQLDGSATAQLGFAGLSLGVAGAALAVLSYSVDRDGRPLRLAAHLAGEADAEIGLQAARRASEANGAARRGAAVELDAILDLHDPVNRAAALDVLGALTRPRALLDLPARARVLGTRFAAAGVLDRRVYALQRSTTGAALTLGLGVEAGGAFERTTSGLRLLSAETRLPGLPFLPRDDCRPA
jgi:hypothetical protein